MRLHERLHSALRRYGLDLYHHMAGGSAFPFRIWTVPGFGLLDEARRIPYSIEVEMERCTSFVGFSYRTGGWNPHVATLGEYLADPSLRYEDSSLHRVHQVFVPRTLQELFVEDAKTPLDPLSDLPPLRRLFRYIWTLSPSQIERVITGAGEPTGHHYFGPMTLKKGKQQFERLLDTFHAIKENGFHPERFGPVKGYFLADESEYRFVVGSGNHRLAVLKVLGHSTVPVCLTSTHPAVVHRSRLDSWSVDNGGPFTTSTAIALFDKLSGEDGLRKARNLGVIGPSEEASSAIG